MNYSQSTFAIRRRGELPPTPPLPSSIQTLACRLMPLGFFEWCRGTLGDRFTIYPVPTPPVVFLSNPADISAVFRASSSVLRPGAGGATISPIVGPRSFMLSDAAEHTHGRRTILPAFAATALSKHADTVREMVHSEVERWPTDTPFRTHPRLRSMSLGIVLRTIFAHEQPAKLQALHEHMLRMLDVTASFTLVEPRLRRLPGWKGIWRRFLEERGHVDLELRRLIGDRPIGGGGDDLLAMLLAAGNPDGSPQEAAGVRDNLVSLVLAGHETTASQIAWALQLLAHAPRAQASLAAEVDTGRNGGYLRATVAEVLRHRPVFLFAIPRAVVAPIEIRGWTYHPPAQLLACIYLLHHDPKVFEHPQVFRPERFLEGVPSEWLPWGGGHKRCPGHRLATLELSAVLEDVIGTRTILPASESIESARWRSVIVTPGDGSRVVLRRRGSRFGRGGVRGKLQLEIASYKFA
jgi:cytochrome P450